MGDAAAFARQHGFFFIEVPANYKASGGVGVLHKTEAVDSVFFAIGATLLDNAKRELVRLVPYFIAAHTATVVHRCPRDECTYVW